jgi:3-hydroxyisobutyrate dehydrogenase-like beta-hydroxyacid dehydrogenase
VRNTQKIGFIGVGIMGHGLAKNIAQAGYPLLFLEHPGNQPVDDLYEQGVGSNSNITDIARHSDVIVMCVTGSPQVEQIVVGRPGLLEGLGPDKTVVDCSTVEPHVSRAMGARIEETGAGFLDAPLTRTPREAELGKANVMVGGDAAVLEQVRPILETFSENIYHPGPRGAGATLKLLHNFISLGNCVLLCEAVVSATKSNVDIDTFIEVLTTGGGDSTALKRLAPYIRDGDVGNFMFSIANSTKDTGYYSSLAQHLDVSAIAADAIHQVFKRAGAEGLGDRPVPELIDALLNQTDSMQGASD